MNQQQVIAILTEKLGNGVLPAPQGASGPYDWGMAMEVDERPDGLYTRTRWHGEWSEWAKL